MTKKWRVAEIFGPTIQGEGRNVGMPCYFVRFGGCDFRCSWCDTPHAVLPDLVAQLPQMDAWDIFFKVRDLAKATDNEAEWIVITGGNPGLLDLGEVIDKFHHHNYKVMLETQGTTYRQWYTRIDDLCFSPKPPSSGNTSDLDLLDKILGRMWTDREETDDPATWFSNNKPYLKIPIFTDEDLDFAEEVRQRFLEFELFLSIGNVDPTLPTVGNPDPLPISAESKSLNTMNTRDVVLNQFREVVEKVLIERPRLQGCRIFPQQHTLIWGNERGH